MVRTIILCLALLCSVDAIPLPPVVGPAVGGAINGVLSCLGRSADPKHLLTVSFPSLFTPRNPPSQPKGLAIPSDFDLSLGAWISPYSTSAHHPQRCACRSCTHRLFPREPSSSNLISKKE
jgi:hypothetical protein